MIDRGLSEALTGDRFRGSGLHRGHASGMTSDWPGVLHPRGARRLTSGRPIGWYSKGIRARVGTGSERSAGRRSGAARSCPTAAHGRGRCRTGRRASSRVAELASTPRCSGNCRPWRPSTARSLPNCGPGGARRVVRGPAAIGESGRGASRAPAAVDAPSLARRAAGDPPRGAAVAPAGDQRHGHPAPHRPGAGTAGGGGGRGGRRGGAGLLQPRVRARDGRARPAGFGDRAAAARVDRGRGGDRGQQQRRRDGPGPPGPGRGPRGDRLARAARRDRRQLPAAGDLRGLGGPAPRGGHDEQDATSDYERAIGPETAAILRVHHSNFRIVGFTEEAPWRAWCSSPTTAACG